MNKILHTCLYFHKGLIYFGLLPINTLSQLKKNLITNNKNCWDLLIKLLIILVNTHTGIFMYFCLRPKTNLDIIVTLVQIFVFRILVIFSCFHNLNLHTYQKIFKQFDSINLHLSTLNINFDYKSLASELLLILCASICRILVLFILSNEIMEFSIYSYAAYVLIFHKQYMRICLCLIQCQICSYNWIVLKLLKSLNKFVFRDETFQLLRFYWIYVELYEAMECLHKWFAFSIGIVFLVDLTYGVILVYRNLVVNTLTVITLQKLIFPITTTVSIVYCYKLLDNEVSKL